MGKVKGFKEYKRMINENEIYKNYKHESSKIGYQFT